MDTNGTCCENPKNKLHMAPSVSSAVAVMPAITTTVVLNARSTISSMGPLFSTTPSSTLHSNQTSSSSTPSTTANTSTPASKHTITVGTKTVAIVLSLVFGVGTLISIFLGRRAYLRRKRRLERFHRVEAGCRTDALEMANRAHRANMEFSRRWNYLFHRSQNPANGQQADTCSAESAKSESAPTTVSRLASSGRNAESQLALDLLKELPYSQIEQVESDTGLPDTGLPDTGLPNTDLSNPGSSDTNSAVNREPTAELEPETLASRKHNSTSQQPKTSNRSETLALAQLDGPSSPPPDTDRAASLEPTPAESSKSQEPAQEEDTSAAKDAGHLQVGEEMQRQWSWQQGDDEHLQRKRSLGEQIENKE